jgi:hypothetical protein
MGWGKVHKHFKPSWPGLTRPCGQAWNIFRAVSLTDLHDYGRS